MDNSYICIDVFENIIKILTLDDFKSIMPIALTCMCFSKIIAKNALKIADKHADGTFTELLGEQVLLVQLPNGVNHGVQSASIFEDQTLDLTESTETWILGKRVGYHTWRVYSHNTIPTKINMYACNARNAPHISKIKIKASNVNVRAQIEGIHSIYVIVDKERVRVNSIHDIIFHLIENDARCEFSPEYVRLALEI